MKEHRTRKGRAEKRFAWEKVVLRGEEYTGDPHWYVLRWAVEGGRPYMASISFWPMSDRADIAEDLRRARRAARVAMVAAGP